MTSTNATDLSQKTQITKSELDTFLLNLSISGSILELLCTLIGDKNLDKHIQPCLIDLKELSAHLLETASDIHEVLTRENKNEK
ncbi:hypothetical protein ACU5EH_20625 [Aliivibrio salmonicida]|uniref:hypothetical protein n=1 Tax=Aliivibrio salmonicida TaxID=40269 RepID=UPI00406CC891